MIRVYKYGLKPPANFADDCEAELRRMNDLWNKLVEIDRAREAAFRQMCISASPEYATAVRRLDELKPLVDELYDDIRAERVKLRSMEPSPEMKERKDILQGERKQLWETCRVIQKALPKDLQKPINENYKADVKLARQRSGCFWGNYNAVIESFETAKSKAIKDGGRLHFKPFDGSGRFVNQIIGGLTVEKLLASAHSQAKLSLPATVDKKVQGQFTWTAYTGKTDEGKHLRRELTAALTYHRPIPAEGLIKSIEVIRTPNEGKVKFKWHVCFTVSLPDEDIVHPKGNVVGVNFGWRQFGSRIRVAVAVDDKNQKSEYYLPPKLVHKFSLAENLQKQADEAENAMLATLRTYYHEQSSRAPQEWKEAVQGILRNRPSREAAQKLTACWSGCLDAFDDKEIYQQWLGWTKADKKARMSYTRCRKNAVRGREELYRHYAKELSDRYAVIAVTDTPLATMNRTKGSDGLGIDNELPEAARRNRVIAGLYTLKEWIEKQSSKTGAIVEKITDKVTATCHKCGHIEETRKGGAQYFTCTNCGYEHEVDVNAAINCRKLASGDVTKEKKVAKASKYMRVREAMEAKNDSARNEGLEAAVDAA